MSPARRLAPIAFLVLAPVAAAQDPQCLASAPAGDTSGFAHCDGGPLVAMFPPSAEPAGGGCPADPFAAGAKSAEARGGAYFSSRLGAVIPSFDYVPVSVRGGWMVTGLEDHWWGRGNYECLCDLTGAPVTSRYGSWLAGLSLLLRSNWVEPGAPIVPYGQVGAGGVLTDAYRDRAQRAIGQEFEFYLHSEVGVKCFVSPNLSLDVEAGLQHISNSGMSRRNFGANALGTTVGLTYYFFGGE